MKLSELQGVQSPTKLSSVMESDASAPTQEAPSFWSEVTKPVRAIPAAIGQQFKEGRETVRSAVGESHEAMAKGEIPSTMSSLKYLGGATQEVMSPITGAVKALYGDPIRAAIPGKLGQAAGNVAETVTAGAGPTVVAKSLSALSKLMPGYSEAVQKLMDAGVKLTPGDIAQGLFKRAEDALRSFPGLGDIIASAQYRSLEDFNRAVFDKALAKVGEKLPPGTEMGPKAVQTAENIIGKKYDALLPKLTFASDKTLAQDVADIQLKTIRLLPGEQQKQWGAIIKDITDRMTKTPTGGYTTDGQTYKFIDSELAFRAREYSVAQDPDKKMFGSALTDLRASMRDALERGNPQKVRELRDINAAWAAFERARGASVRRVQSNGVFSPADLLGDIKKSTGRGAFARGDGLLQDFASAANHVLPATVPDSGTMRRALMAELVGTGGAALADRPDVVVGLISGAAPYTKPGMAAVNAAAKGLPTAAKGANQALRSPALAGAAAASDEASQ